MNDTSEGRVSCNPKKQCLYKKQRQLVDERMKGEGRMSRLKLRENPGKVVLERSEGVSSCLRERLTSCAAGVQHFFSALHEIRL